MFKKHYGMRSSFQFLNVRHTCKCNVTGAFICNTASQQLVINANSASFELCIPNICICKGAAWLSGGECDKENAIAAFVDSKSLRIMNMIN